MKKAFVSGVASLFQVFKFNLPEVSEDECKSYMKHLDGELAKQPQEVRRCRAEAQPGRETAGSARFGQSGK
jgi:hypothetical protein